MFLLYIRILCALFFLYSCEFRNMKLDAMAVSCVKITSNM
jgi:hypothetical protein